MNSIYHFFKELYQLRNNFLSENKLEDFPFPQSMIACVNKGTFPDLAIKLNVGNSEFTGGELIELKDSKSNIVSSFNSTIPTGTKEISKIIGGPNSTIRKQMQEAGNNIESLPVRDVFYLVRGRKREHTKVVLVHGSFFETVNSDSLISKSFLQAFREMLHESDVRMPNKLKKLFNKLTFGHENFSRVRDVENASVKLRFRIMTEVKHEGNILNEEKYPQIEDDTLNLLLPYHNKKELEQIENKFNSVFDEASRNKFVSLNVKHHFNGYYKTFQTSLINTD
jgi:hypothetical protein